MAYEQEGFFSPELDQFRVAMRSTHPTKPWFDFALGLNRIGFDLLRQARTLTVIPRCSRCTPSSSGRTNLFKRR
jgi:hypothetical protein